MPKILFGAGRIKDLPSVLSSLGQKPLVVHYGESPAPILPYLPSGAVFYRQKGEPVHDKIDQAVQIGRTNQVDCVIGIGGGSALDAAKAIAGLLTHPGSCLDYLEVVGNGLKLSKPALPWVAIPTTAGTGSEVTRNAVIAVPHKQFKASLRGEGLIPRVAIVDPELHLHIPPSVTAASGLDALSQCIEAYVSKNASPITDPLAFDGVFGIGQSLYEAYLKPSDIDARTNMALAALLSGIALSNAGLGVIHGFAAPIGAAFPAPHGVVCGRLLPSALSVNIQNAIKKNLTPILNRFSTIGKALGCPADADPLEFAIKKCKALCQAMKVPPLSSFGLVEERFQEMIELAKKGNSIKYNPVELSDEELWEILLAEQL